MSGGVDWIPCEIPPLTNMPRRKQNYPKRMKGEDSDSESVDVNEEDATEDTSPSCSVGECDESPAGAHLDLQNSQAENNFANGKDELATISEEVTDNVIDYSVKKSTELNPKKRSADSPLDLSLPHRKMPIIHSPPIKSPSNDKPPPYPQFASNSFLNFIPGSVNFTGINRESNHSQEGLVKMPPFPGYPMDVSLLHFPPKVGLHPSDSFKCVLCQRRCQNLLELSQHIKEHIIPPGLGMGPMFPPSPVPPQPHPSVAESSRVPRKLVRGQDVWLGKGAEQTKQILKCMWCGQSFSSLADMTTHMQQTQHYTNILSQEQVVPWRGQDPKGSSPHSVMVCKVCDKGFATLQELTTHMVHKSHFFDPVQNDSQHKKKLVKEKRRSRSLPVRKLLEMGRRHSLAPSEEKPPRSGTCEKCECRLDSVEHLKTCKGKEKTSPSPVEDLRLGDRTSEGDKSGELSALENLIEKSFDKTFNEQYKSVNILQKLGLEGGEALMRSQFPTQLPISLCKIPPNRSDTPCSGQTSPTSSQSASPDHLQDKESPALSASSSEFHKSPSGAEDKSDSAHPLAALQKLCDQTHKSTKNLQMKGHLRGMASTASLMGSGDDGAGTIKCAFCDISLISKTSYQSHLAEVHFIKDGTLLCKSPSPGKSAPQDLDDSPTSKFVKYSELAKQLSSAHCN